MTCAAAWGLLSAEALARHGAGGAAARLLTISDLRGADRSGIAHENSSVVAWFRAAQPTIDKSLDIH